ncbi:PepSY-associated TM helix domain-containing protein [uncultured Thiodictyon sp.]|uniref:PepSY-associated TM helix domain-containing protein n=1 Tax=uncultured Thiodictyon sp. TaxID=1846217 RepID=UPI0025D729A3|nr:PepSY-associated TM helix domain-containing protein [uncultured Thiodictyon sp.]
MFPKQLKRPLLIAHRWLALGLAPVFLLILLSGAILAFKPILGAGSAAQQSARPSVTAVAAALDAIDPAGRAAAVSLSADGRSISLKSKDPAVAGTFEVATRAAPASQDFDLFAVALSLHKNLLIGAGLLVEIATYALVAILAAGLVFGLPKLRNTLGGWHRGMGWFALPLLALLPVTGLLMTLHVGKPALPALAPGEPISLAQAIQAVPLPADGTILMARRFQAGAAMVKTTSSAGERLHVVQANGQVALTGEPGWVDEVHEGTWAGAWSGVLNLVSALALMGVTVTGLYSWLRRRSQARRSGRVAAQRRPQACRVASSRDPKLA